MNGRDALRRYLEQRKELGESELVLDALSVEQVLALVGVRAGAAPTEAPADEVGAPADHPRLAAEPNIVREEPANYPSAPPAEPADDWRTTLRAAGHEPARAPTPPREAVAPPSAPEPPADDELPPTAAGGPRRISDIDAAIGLVYGAESLAAVPVGDPVDSLDAVAALVAGCTRCPLFRTATRPVPGEGNAHAELVVVGEAPGAEEDASGRPFVGAAGQLLTKILAAISLSREDVFVVNVMKHRPPGNRNPEPDEVAACSPYLVRQLELIRPKAILTLGNFAAQTLLGTKLGISKLRGQVHRYHGIPLVATYHPAALLRNPTWKRPTWEDVQLARRILDRADAR